MTKYFDGATLFLQIKQPSQPVLAEDSSSDYAEPSNRQHLRTIYCQLPTQRSPSGLVYCPCKNRQIINNF